MGNGADAALLEVVADRIGIIGLVGEGFWRPLRQLDQLLQSAASPAVWSSMRWSIAASTIIGVFVFVIFFWLTLKFLDYWNNSAVDASEIQIIEASYGLNCKVPTGNATEDVSTECNHKSRTCNYSVNVAKLGDPAPGCGKDFFVKWRCGSILDARQASLEPEAHGKSLEIFCATR